MPGSRSDSEVESGPEAPVAGRGSIMFGVGLAFLILELLLCGFGVFIVTRIPEVSHPLAGVIFSLLTAGVALVPALVAGVLFYLVRRAREAAAPWLARFFWLPLLPPVLLCALTFGVVALIT